MAGFSQEVIELAQKSERDYGVPTSVTLAQYAYESGWGTSGHAKNHNNYFGMKYRNGSGNSDKTKWYTSNGAKWQHYSSMAQSFDDHGRLLSSDKYYNLTKDTATIDEYVKAFAETYAPSSDGNNNYAGNVLSIIRQYNLNQYNVLHWNYEGMPTGEPITETPETETGGSGTSGGSEEEVWLYKTEFNDPDGSWDDYWIIEAEWWDYLWSYVIKFIATVALAVLAYILMQKAFDAGDDTI